MPIILSLLIFLAVLSLLVGLYGLVHGRRATIENRLRRMVVGPVEREELAEAAFMANVDRRRRKTREAKGPGRYVVRLENKLLAGGLLLRAREFAMLAGGLTLSAAVMMFLLSGAVVNAVLVLAAGPLLSFGYLNMRVERRKQTLNAQIADMIMFMANGLKAGHSLVQVMEGVSREIGPPLSDHLKAFLRDTVMGVPMEEALVKLDERAGDEDLSMVITAILIQYQVGGNLSEILDNISITIRERVRIKQEIQTLTAQGRMSAIIICLLPVALGVFITMINPDFMAVLFREPLGLMMVGAAVFFELIGVLVIRRIVEIRV